MDNEPVPSSKNGRFSGIVIFLLVLAGTFFVLLFFNNNSDSRENQTVSPSPTVIPTPIVTPSPPVESEANNAIDATYIIEGNPVKFTGGVATVANGDSTNTYKVWGTPVMGNLNTDTYTDAAVIIEHPGAGSGIFYYVSASIQNDKSLYTGTNAILLGDRIAMQNYSINPEYEILVNYADRKPDEPMTASPSVGVSGYFKLDADSTLIEVTK